MFIYYSFYIFFFNFISFFIIYYIEYLNIFFSFIKNENINKKSIKNNVHYTHIIYILDI